MQFNLHGGRRIRNRNQLDALIMAKYRKSPAKRVLVKLLKLIEKFIRSWRQPNPEIALLSAEHQNILPVTWHVQHFPTVFFCAALFAIHVEA